MISIIMETNQCLRPSQPLLLQGVPFGLSLQWQLEEALGHLTGSPTGARRGPCGACWLAEHSSTFPFSSATGPNPGPAVA